MPKIKNKNRKQSLSIFKRSKGKDSLQVMHKLLPLLCLIVHCVTVHVFEPCIQSKRVLAQCGLQKFIDKCVVTSGIHFEML